MSITENRSPDMSLCKLPKVELCKSRGKGEALTPKFVTVVVLVFMQQISFHRLLAAQN
jgi:hypothetical protein